MSKTTFIVNKESNLVKTVNLFLTTKPQDDLLEFIQNPITESKSLIKNESLKHIELPPTDQTILNEKKKGNDNDLSEMTNKEKEVEIEAILIRNEKNEDENEQKKLGRKRLNSETEGKHNKYCDDNLRRKCKHIVLAETMEFINKKIEKIYKGNLGQGMLVKKLLTLNHSQKANAIVQYNKDFLNKKLVDIFSEDISTRYTNFAKEHNKFLIKYLIEEKDIEKRNYFNKLFNLTFLECLKHFRGQTTINELIGLSNMENAIKKYYDSEDYNTILTYYLKNFDSIIMNKKSRSKREKKKNKDVNKN